MPRITQANARRRAEGVCRVMPKWSVHVIRKDGTVVFEIDNGKMYTLIEFAPEHWAALDAVINS